MPETLEFIAGEPIACQKIFNFFANICDPTIISNVKIFWGFGISRIIQGNYPVVCKILKGRGRLKERGDGGRGKEGEEEQEGMEKEREGGRGRGRGRGRERKGEGAGEKEREMGWGEKEKMRKGGRPWEGEGGRDREVLRRLERVCLTLAEVPLFVLEIRG